jgi:hypothetical protein
MLIMNISIPQQIIGVRISLPAGVFITSINRAPELGVPGIGIGVALVFIWFKIQVRRQKYVFFGTGCLECFKKKWHEKGCLPVFYAVF